MFMGEYNHTIDEKGRIIVPSKFRECLGENFVVTQGLDGCLFVYSYDEWENFVDGLKKLPGTKEARQLQRYFMAGAAQCEVEKEGRKRKTSKPRIYARLEKKGDVVGVLLQIEKKSKKG